MITPTQRKIISKIRKLSDTYHKLSLLSYTFSKSLEVKCERENMTTKEFKEYLSGNWFMDKLNGFGEMIK